MNRSRLSRYGAIARMAYAVLQAEWMIRRRPFSETARRLSQPLARNRFIRDPPAAAREIRADLASLCRYLPWNPSCLVKAVAAHTMLAKRQVSAMLVLSVMPDESAAASAHAWLEAAGIVVTGGNGRDKFVPIFRFDNRPKERIISLCSR
jgi:transglutaminase superfamily protein